MGRGGGGGRGGVSSELVGWVLLYVHRNRRLIRDRSPGWPPRLSHSSRAVSSEWVIVAFYGMFLKIHPSGVLTTVFSCCLAGAMRSCCHLGTHSLYTIQKCTNFFSLCMLSMFCVHKVTHERKTTTTTKHLLISNLCWCVPCRTRRSRIIQCSRKLSSKCICFVVSCLHPCLLFFSLK